MSLVACDWSRPRRAASQSAAQWPEEADDEWAAEEPDVEPELGLRLPPVACSITLATAPLATACAAWPSTFEWLEEVEEEEVECWWWLWWRLLLL